jgi:hypothetical protein
MKRNCFYFIQPDILLNTNKYKIGISESYKYERLNSYGKKRRTIMVLEDIHNVRDFEKIIIRKFNKKFTNIGRNEYFEGSEILMCDIIYQTFMKYKYNIDIQIKNMENDILYISSSDNEDDMYDDNDIYNDNLIIKYNIFKIGKKYINNYHNYLLYKSSLSVNLKLLQNNKIYKKKHKNYIKKLYKKIFHKSLYKKNI